MRCTRAGQALVPVVTLEELVQAETLEWVAALMTGRGSDEEIDSGFNS